MTESTIIYLLAGLCFVLGFVALLKQKTYIDSQTNQPTEIELPFVGKLTTNYPALGFVFIGGRDGYFYLLANRSRAVVRNGAI